MWYLSYTYNLRTPEAELERLLWGWGWRGLCSWKSVPWLHVWTTISKTNKSNTLFSSSTELYQFGVTLFYLFFSTELQTRELSLTNGVRKDVRAARGDRSAPGPPRTTWPLGMRASLTAASVPHCNFPLFLSRLKTNLESGIGFRKLRKVLGSWLAVGTQRRQGEGGRTWPDSVGECGPIGAWTRQLLNFFLMMLQTHGRMTYEKGCPFYSQSTK